MIAGLVVFGVFTIWIQRMPPGFDSLRGVNPLAAAGWRARFHAGGAGMDGASYRAGVQVLQVMSWVCYGALLALVYRGARFGAAWTWRLAVPLVVAVAVAMPAALSADVFAYVGYARLAVVHGMNPHLATQVDLVKLGDPTKPYLHWPIASPYGPLWTLVCMAVVAAGELVARSNVWGPVLALKLIAAAGVLGMAAALRVLVGRGDEERPGTAGALDRGAEPRRADAAFVLTVVNPLLLTEGPGNAHNDVVMMALALAGFVAWLTPARARPRPWLAAAAFGVAAAVKLIPLLVLPWLALDTLRPAAGSAPPPPARARWRRLARAAGIALVGLAPVVLSYAPFWSGGRALGGLAERFRSADAPDDAPPAARAPPPASGAVGEAPAPGASPRRPLRAPGHPFAHVVRRTWLSALVYAAATLLLLRGGVPLLPLTAWAYVSGVVMLFVAGLWFPWYLSWTWPAVLARTNRHHQILTLLLFLFSVLLMMVYATPP